MHYVRKTQSSSKRHTTNFSIPQIWRPPWPIDPPAPRCLLGPYLCHLSTTVPQKLPWNQNWTLGVGDRETINHLSHGSPTTWHTKDLQKCAVKSTKLISSTEGLWDFVHEFKAWEGECKQFIMPAYSYFHLSVSHKPKLCSHLLTRIMQAIIT